VKRSVDYFHAHHFPLPAFLPAISRECGHPYKPSPAALLHICEAWGIQPHECVMVGDSAKDDVGGWLAGPSGPACCSWGGRGSQRRPALTLAQAPGSPQRALCGGRVESKGPGRPLCAGSSSSARSLLLASRLGRGRAGVAHAVRLRPQGICSSEAPCTPAPDFPRPCGRGGACSAAPPPGHLQQRGALHARA
jgi:hypothetical protein